MRFIDHPRSCATVPLGKAAVYPTWERCRTLNISPKLTRELSHENRCYQSKSPHDHRTCPANAASSGFTTLTRASRPVEGNRLPLETSAHESSPHAPHPLDDVQVLISASMGPGLRQRLTAGITALMAQEDRSRPGSFRLPARDGDSGPGSCDHSSDPHHHHP